MTTATRTRKAAPKSAPASTVVDTVQPVIEGTIHEGNMPQPEPQPEPAPASTEARISALKQAWTKGTEDETSALFSLGTARVIKARVAYMAGALGSKSGAPNNKAAMRILDLPQNTIRPYFLAGVALAEAGWDGHITAPTAAEIELVSGIISKVTAKAPKADEAPKAPKDTDDTDADDDDTEAPAAGGRVSDPDAPITEAKVLEAAAEFFRTLNGFCNEHGFSAVSADLLMEMLAEAGATIDSHRIDGGS